MIGVGTGPGIGVDQTASRATGTTYTNTLGQKMLVTVTFTAGASDSALSGLAGTASPPTEEVYLNLVAATYKDTVQFVVPAGHNYRLNNTGSVITIAKWWEAPI